jgi:CO/xanthine dehydrogenase FAD-binding subunit
MILLRQRLLDPDVIVSLDDVAELRPITDDDGALRLGATAPYASVMRSAEVSRRLPLLARAAGSVGSVHIRNRGTVGGSVCHADPAGDVPVALTAADARLRVRRGDGGQADLSIDGFFTGLFETALEDGDLLEAVEVPLQPTSATYGYRRFSYREGEYPMCVAAVRLEWADGRCTGARVAVGGAGPSVTRLAAAEAVLVGSAPDGDLAGAAASAADDDVEPIADVRGSTEWKRRVVRQTVRAAIAEAVQGGGSR